MLKHVMDYLTGNDQKEDERRFSYGELPQGQRYLNNAAIAFGYAKNNKEASSMKFAILKEATLVNF